jgi:hypothetical protein
MIQNKYKRNKKNNYKKEKSNRYDYSSNSIVIKDQEYYNSFMLSKASKKDVHDIAVEIFGNTYYITNFN